MIIVYVSRLSGTNADVSYNTAWQGLWAFAEISFGIIVACTFSLPKLIEAKGTHLRSVFSSLTRPFTSLTSSGYFGISMSSKKDNTASQGVALDRVTMTGHSEAELSIIRRYQEMEGYSSYEGEYNPTENRSSSRPPH